MPTTEPGFTPPNPPSNRILGGVWRGEPGLSRRRRPLLTTYTTAATVDDGRRPRRGNGGHCRPPAAGIGARAPRLGIGQGPAWPNHVHTVLMAPELASSAKPEEGACRHGMQCLGAHINPLSRQ